MAEANYTVQVVRTGPRRKTLALEVHPGGDVVVRAPDDCDDARIQALLAKRQGWIAAQRDYFRQFDPRTPTRTWVMGESHLHLGKRLKLRYATGARANVTIDGMDLVVTIGPCASPEPLTGATLVERWRHHQARAVLPRVLDQCFSHYRFREFGRPALRIQRLAKRWGSLSVHGTMTLHTGLVQAPMNCIRYVIWHELCHLIHPDHSSGFFGLLGEVCPDWKSDKRMLESLLR